MIKAFGAGILSSPGETRHSIDSPDSNRVLIDPADDHDLLRLATTDYLISEYQKTYFVMKDFESLRSLTPERILTVTHAAQKLPHYTWRELAPGDHVLTVGKAFTSPNEKYYRLLAGQPLDACLRRTAIRNLRMYAKDTSGTHQAARAFAVPSPDVPLELIDQFRTADARSVWRLERFQGDFGDVHAGPVVSPVRTGCNPVLRCRYTNDEIATVLLERCCCQLISLQTSRW